MNILHVSLGLPPLRTGGLNRYCAELMKTQVALGENVSLLFPGRFLPGKVRLRRSNWHGVRTYELINPLPLALTYGVAEPKAFVAPCNDRRIFSRLLADVKPDVVHVHSYMGVYQEFFYAVKSCGIPIVFTTHDYYPMCPRCTFIDAWGQNCVTGANARACSICCYGGMSLRKSVIMQSKLYSSLKLSPLYGKLASIVKQDMALKGRFSSEDVVKEGRVDDYQYLLDYNEKIFEFFDLVLTNSSMTEKIYQRVFPDMTYKLAWISHEGLYVEKKSGDTRDYELHNRPLVIGYFGGRKEYKGYETLLEASRILHNADVEFELRLYGDDYGENVGVSEAQSFGRVEQDQMNDVLKVLDVVVVPSIYHETLSFVVLEALCAGVPVICSDAVGASELLNEDAIFRAGDPISLAERIKGRIVGKLGNQFIPQGYPLSMEQQAHEIKICYMEARGRNKCG